MPPHFAPQQEAQPTAYNVKRSTSPTTPQVQLHAGWHATGKKRHQRRMHAHLPHPLAPLSVLFVRHRLGAVAEQSSAALKRGTAAGAAGTAGRAGAVRLSGRTTGMVRDGGATCPGLQTRAAAPAAPPSPGRWRRRRQPGRHWRRDSSVEWRLHKGRDFKTGSWPSQPQGQAVSGLVLRHCRGSDLGSLAGDPQLAHPAVLPVSSTRSLRHAWRAQEMQLMWGARFECNLQEQACAYIFRIIFCLLNPAGN